MTIRTPPFLPALVLALALVVPGAAEAQVLTIGVKGGVNVADVSVDDPGETLETDNVTGLVAGGFLRLGGPVFAIQPELLFAQKGFSSDDFDGVSAELSVDYVEVPLLFSARLPAPLVRPFAYAGPVFSFETSCELSAESGGVESSEACEDVDISTESTDVGVALGGGVDLSLGGILLIGDVRYTIGLRNIDASDGEDEVKNRAWSIMAGVGVPIF